MCGVVRCAVLPKDPLKQGEWRHQMFYVMLCLLTVRAGSFLFNVVRAASVPDDEHNPPFAAASPAPSQQANACCLFTIAVCVLAWDSLA